MTLEEQLAMATGTTTVTSNTVPQGQAQTMTTTMTNPAQMQAEAQVVQPTTTAMQLETPPVQMATVGELHTETPAQTPQIVENVGVQTIEWGQPIVTKPIELLKLKVNEPARIAILPVPPQQIRYHQSDIFGGKFSCFSTEETTKKCCMDYGPFKTKLCYAVLLYPTMPNDPTTLIPNAEAQLRILTSWDRAIWNAIDEVMKNSGGKPVDMKVTQLDNYGRLDIRAENTVSFTNQFADAIQKACNKYMTHFNAVPSLVRMNMNEAEYDRRMANVGQAANYSNANYGGYNNNNYSNYNNTNNNGYNGGYNNNYNGGYNNNYNNYNGGYNNNYNNRG